MAPRIDVVVPTIGRGSLTPLLDALAAQVDLLLPERVVLVDDRRSPAPPLLPAGPPAALADRLTVVAGGGGGPAAARNAGWHAGGADWVAFLDDDVIPETGWAAALRRDVGFVPPWVGATQGTLAVPLTSGRRPTDWERNVRGLETARWATADMAYRRASLVAAGGFDERFPRAYREDADLGLRVTELGWSIVRGERRVLHPVRPAGPGVSLRLQAGNQDDVLMRALHGRDWRRRCGAPAGRRRRHVTTTLAGATAMSALAARRPRLALAPAAAWLAGTAELARARIAPGPRDAREVITMLATSAVMPPLATWHTLRGLARLPRLVSASSPPAAVLLDRDGTLIQDVPHNGDPDRVRAMPGAPEALARLRAAGVPTAVVTNQSGLARGLLTRDRVDAVNRRVESLLGPVGPWLVCEHAPGDGCDCHKPRPGLLLRAARQLGVAPEACALIGDIGSDVDAALAAGARPVLVPTGVTRAEEIAAAPETATGLRAAVDLLLGQVGR
jgi:histidinol-phosphate phosphatase family protein